MENKILQGNALTKLKELPEKSINMCMTSPPYWALRDYGTASWEGGDENCDHLPSNIITTAKVGNTKDGIGRQPFKDVCGKCGAKRVDKQLGLEPTFDQYISNLCDIFDGVKRVLRDDGTCWVNIGDTYWGSGAGTQYEPKTENAKEVYTIPYNSHKNTQRNKDSNYQSKCLCMIPQRFAIEMVNRGWILRNTIIWHKPNAMPSSVKDRFTVDFEYLFFFSKKRKYYFEQQLEEIKECSKERYKKPFKSLKGNFTSLQRGENITDTTMLTRQGRNKRTVWAITTKPYSESHFAVYPEELCETPIKAGCPVGGIVLDPFFGAGTTGLVALKQKKKFIGIELNKEYIEIATKRLKPFLEQTTL